MNIDLQTILGIAAVAAMGFFGGYVSRKVNKLSVPERIDLMQARTKHATGLLIMASLVSLAGVVFTGGIDIRDPFISALVVQFLNTLKDLSIGPSLNYFPRPEHKPTELVSAPKSQETSTTTTTTGPPAPPPVATPPTAGSPPHL